MGCSFLLARGISINPRLDPQSHDKFFGSDYPHDVSPSAQGLEFGHPYPAVMASDAFDKDYVKDENGDGGEWKAQFEYDTLRTKAQQEKADQEAAEEAAEAAQQVADAARKEQEKAEGAAEQGEKAASD